MNDKEIKKALVDFTKYLEDKEYKIHEKVPTAFSVYNELPTDKLIKDYLAVKRRLETRQRNKKLYGKMLPNYTNDKLIELIKACK